MNRFLATGLLAACTMAAVGCSSTEPPTQVVTGQVTTSGALAVRAVASGAIITAGRVRTDGSFTLALPVGAQYRLEVLTATGVYHLAGASGELAFSVCRPSDPFDLGTIGAGGGAGTVCDPAKDPTCKGPPACDPAKDPNGCKPPACDPAKDPNGCKPPACDPAKDPNGCRGCDPAKDPNGCKGPPPSPCDPAKDPNGCKPPACDPAKDPNGCKPCDPSATPNCPITPPPCADPSDPATCKDPCMTDPGRCACPATNDKCWPPPVSCAPGGTCQAGGLVPGHAPGDFGCGGPAKS
jgi:hypothetical protein